MYKLVYLNNVQIYSSGVMFAVPPTRLLPSLGLVHPPPSALPRRWPTPCFAHAVPQGPHSRLGEHARLPTRCSDNELPPPLTYFDGRLPPSKGRPDHMSRTGSGAPARSSCVTGGSKEFSTFQCLCLSHVSSSLRVRLFGNLAGMCRRYRHLYPRN